MSIQLLTACHMEGNTVYMMLYDLVVVVTACILVIYEIAISHSSSVSVSMAATALYSNTVKRYCADNN
jgi:hypothetical protein